MATHSVIPGVFVALAFINGGGLALRWFRDEVAVGLPADAEAYRRLDELAERVDPEGSALLWLPHIQGRVLPPQPHVRGGWVGLTSGHSLGHMYRAILEGVAYEYAEWARLAGEGGADLHEARVLGGGARSRLWNQIKADVLGLDWVPMVRQECGVLGDALIAAAATGHIRDLAAAASSWQEMGERVRPDPDRHRRYQPVLEAYRILMERIDPVFDRLGGIG
jgi:xylulokinase